MRTVAWCLITVALIGCHSGPRWCMRDCDTRGTAHCDDRPTHEPAPQSTQPPPAQPEPDGANNSSPPQPAQRPITPYESSSRSRGWFGNRFISQTTHSKSSTAPVQAARKEAAPVAGAKPAGQDDNGKPLTAELEKIKREKSALETRLMEESAKHTQQRLELEARLALIQEQMRQQSALQQVAYQQQTPMMSRPMTNYSGPVVTSGNPSPAMPMAFSSSQSSPQLHQQPVPAWSNPGSTWSNPAAPSQQQQIEQWPFSPQRR